MKALTTRLTTHMVVVTRAGGVGILIALVLQLCVLALFLNRTRTKCSEFRTLRNRADRTFFDLQMQSTRRRLDASRAWMTAVQRKIAVVGSAGGGADGPYAGVLPAFSHAKACETGPTADETADWIVNARLSRFADGAELQSGPGHDALAELGLKPTGTREDWDYVALWRAIVDSDVTSGSTVLVFAADWGVLEPRSRRKGLPRCAPIVARLAGMGNKVQIVVPTHALVRVAGNNRSNAGASSRGTTWALRPRGKSNTKLKASAVDPKKTLEKAQLKTYINVRHDSLHYLPPDFYERFDFVWSASALERLASTRLGHRFVVDAMGAVKPEGFAMFLFEFDLSVNATARAQTATLHTSKSPTATPVAQHFVVWSWRAVVDLVDDLSELGYLPSVACWRPPNASLMLPPTRRPRVAAAWSGAAEEGDVDAAGGGAGGEQSAASAAAAAAAAVEAEANVMRQLRGPDDFASIRLGSRAALLARLNMDGSSEDEDEDGDGDGGGLLHTPPVLTTMALVVRKPRWWGPVADQGRLWGEGQRNPGIRSRNYSLAVRMHEAKLLAVKKAKAKCKKLIKGKKTKQAIKLGCKIKKKKKKKKKRRR